MNKIKLIITATMFAVLSMVLQLTALETGTGMNLDLVAVPWVLSAFLLGPVGGAITVAVSYLFIALQSSAGWVGATIKLVASLPLVAVFAFVSIRTKNFSKNLIFGTSSVNPSRALLFGMFSLAIVARVLIAHTVNAWFTFPMFGIPVDANIDSLFSVPLRVSVSWIGIIDVLNIIQSLIEFAIVYVLIFKTKIRERLHA